MTTSRTLRRTVAVLLAASAIALGACGDDDGGDDEDAATTTAAVSELTVSDAWVRPATDLAASDRTAVYMEITAGGDGDELVSASVPEDVAGTVELHETALVDDEEAGTGAETDAEMDGEPMTGMEADGPDGDMDPDEMGGDMAGGMMQMREVDRIVIPADGTVSLEPGGLHIMLLDLAGELQPGDSVEVTLVFAEAGEMVVTAEVREP